MSWNLDYGWGFRESLKERARKRLACGTPRQVAENSWIVRGMPELGDEYPDYQVSLVDGRYTCTCYTRRYGDSRARRTCSHVLAVIIHTREKRLSARAAPALGGGFASASAAPGRVLGGEAAPRRQAWISPRELNLPPKFERFRDAQLEALERIRETDKKFVLLQAPTGTGKTLVAAAAQRMLGAKTLYMCHTRDLQDQFCRDFPYAVELKGRENYPTAIFPERFPEVHCGLCTKAKDDPRCRWCCPPDCPYQHGPDGCQATGKCTGKRRCPYQVQKVEALAAKLAVVNMALFLGEANNVGGLGDGNFELIVVDEADLLESALMAYMELAISPRLIASLGLKPPAKKTVEQAWLEWVDAEVMPTVAARLNEIAREERERWSVLDVRRLREKAELERLARKLAFFRREVGTSRWVNCTEDPENGPWVWKPVWVSRYAGSLVWKHAKRFLLMSATILEPKTFASTLGIPFEEVEFVDLPSTFPKENRPVYYVPCANMTHKTAREEWPKVVEGLDAVLDRHPGEKVLVHTVSYALARFAAENSRHRGRLALYGGARDRAEALERFRSSPEPLVMLAPSMTRGVDLPDDLCRVVVVLKVPYRSLGDRQVSARLYGSRDGRAWYVVDAIRTVVQMSGRGVRHERDWAITYILDSQFGVVLKEWKKAFPSWWREALQVKNTF